MRVLHVISSMNPQAGGVCQAVRSYIYGMKDIADINNEVICLDNPDSEYILNESFFIQALGAAHNRTSWNYNKILKPWLKNNIQNYEIIIVHGLWQYQTLVVYQVLKRLKNKPKLLVMPHGMLDPYFQKAKGRKIKAIRNVIFWKLMESKLINSADSILFTCEEEKLLARESFVPYQPKKESVVGLGIECPLLFENKMIKEFSEKCNGWNQKPFLLFLSRIHEKKGVDILVEAYLRLHKEISDMPQLVIAGPGLETSYGQYIRTLSGRNSNILFPGMISGDAKWGAFYACEAFILPSHQENFGIAIVEAMACQKAVIITDKINIWREIKQGNGGLISSDTTEEIYNVLKKWLYLSENDKKEIGYSAKQTFESFFLNDKVVANLEGVFRDII